MARSSHPDPQRRALLGALAALPCLGIRPLWADDRTLDFGSAEPFDFSQLVERARELAQQPYRPPEPKAPELLERIDYDVDQRIQYRPSMEINAGGDYGVRGFHMGRNAQDPIALHLVENGQARRVQYDRRLFAYDDVPFASDLPEDLGFAGFRVMHPDAERDWLAYQGASYFRSAGPLDQYGLSARGIAVDPGLNRDEEFPRFTEFWIEPSGETIIIYALMDGRSVTGAYRFDCHKGSEAITQDVRAEIFQREGVERLGIAPLTSMYWYAEQRDGPDWRPEIHDSDGLALWTGSGERIWRPLNNPPEKKVNSYVDENPRGFGLLQRDRNFAHYQDDGVWYNRRPSVWIEPKGDWGRGSVQLFELPTDDEIYDNINCYWVPEEPAEAGRHWRFDYRLHWTGEEPYKPESVGTVRATRLGRSGVPGQPDTANPHGRKFAIDFEGGPIADLEQRYDVDMVVEASAGGVENPYALKVVDHPYWRGVFDLILDPGTQGPVNLRCYLRLEGETLTETWHYQYFPHRS